MNFGFSMVFFAVWPGGRRCTNCRDAHFFERYCDESIFTSKNIQNNNGKKQKKSSDPWARSGRGLAGDMGLNFFFSWFFHGFLQFSQKPREHKKKSSNPWARSGLSTHKPKNQKTKKPKNQKTKKNKKTKKKQDCTPQGEGGQMQSVGSCLFVFFVFFVFWFFGLCVDSYYKYVKQKLPGTVSGCTRGRAGKNQKTKKPKKTKKTKIAHHKGRGSDAEC